MTTYTQYANGVKMRHDYSDMIQVRYLHSDGENYDTWISGEEVLARLKTMSRTALIQSFSRMDWQEAKERLEQELESGKNRAKRNLMGRLADTVSDQIGDNIFGDTLADKIRGVDSSQDARAQEKAQWQAHLQHDAFRAVAIDLAWINIGDTLPAEGSAPAADDWV